LLQIQPEAIVADDRETRTSTTEVQDRKIDSHPDTGQKKRGPEAVDIQEEELSGLTEEEEAQYAKLEAEFFST
jgi:hypothetical protein